MRTWHSPQVDCAVCCGLSPPCEVSKCWFRPCAALKTAWSSFSTGTKRGLHPSSSSAHSSSTHWWNRRGRRRGQYSDALSASITTWGPCAAYEWSARQIAVAKYCFVCSDFRARCLCHRSAQWSHMPPSVLRDSSLSRRAGCGGLSRLEGRAGASDSSCRGCP